MCGIGGMLGNPDAHVLHRMNQFHQHRGPDGQNIWLDEQCGLAHARLAIVDLEGSNQPIESDHGSTLVVNGEIYNYLDLRSPSYRYRTAGDSETILSLHEKFAGGSARDHASWLKQIEGMFAFALWDSKHQQLLLARDTMGIKPLCRTIVNDTLLFSSEFKALRAHEGHVPQIDSLALKARLAWEYPLDGTSLLKGVCQVRPGTVEIWSMESGKPELIDTAMFEHVSLTPQAGWSGPEELLETFVTSVQQRLMSDVPVGIVLSGGLDSSLVSAVAEEAAQRASQPIPKCWTVAEDEDNPDWKAAELVASTLDMEHHQEIIQTEDADTWVTDMSWHGEDLDFTVMFFQPLFQLMSKEVTVGLCGQGADELHAGYPRYTNLNAHRNLVNHRLGKMDVQLHGLEGEQWWNESHTPDIHTNSLKDFLEFEMKHGQLTNFQLRLVDRHSMAHGLEVRVPFLGSAHRRMANHLPMSLRLPENGLEKKALREAANLTNLPKEIVHRPKLPAGRATSPTIIDTWIDELKPRANEFALQSGDIGELLVSMPEISIGYGLFVAQHILDEGRMKKKKSMVDLLDEVID